MVEWAGASVPICDHLWLLRGALGRLEEKDDGERH